MNKWKQTSIGAFIDFNPSESVRKGVVTKKIGMDKLGTFQRRINGYELSEYSNGPKFRNEDTLVAKITPCLENGKTAYVDILDENEVAFGSSEFIVLRENENSDSKFIYYLARSPLFRERAISCMEGTSGRKRVNEGALKRQEILVPLVLEQQKIAAVLSALDDKIELNNKINTELEQMAKTLYDYWFVQFDFPNEEGKPYKSSGGKMVYNDVLKREIPEGWEVKRLEEIAHITMGQSPIGKSYNMRNDGIIFFQGSTDFGWRYPKNRMFTTKHSRLANENDILLSVRAPVGTINIAMFDCCIGRGLSALNSKEGFNSYLLYLMYSYKKKFEIINSVGTTFGSLTKDDLYSLELSYPKYSILSKFESKISTLDLKIKNNTKQNQELAELRDWLLPMLMNGQVSVGDVVDQEDSTVKGDGRIRDLFGDEEYLRRKALAVYIVNQSLGDKSFGKTKFMKLLHLVEYHIVQGSLEQAYYKHAAGPYDGAFAKKFWNEVIEDKWYRIEELGSLNHIIPGENHNGTKDYTSSIEDGLKQQIKAFIHIFKDCNYEQPEVVSTLYAVWNNRIIQKEMITDVLLKQDFLAWDEQKEKYVDILDKALGWMRSNKIVPTGWGKVINASKSRRGLV